MPDGVWKNLTSATPLEATDSLSDYHVPLAKTAGGTDQREMSVQDLIAAGLGIRPFVKPPAAADGWTWVNQGGSTLTDRGSTVNLYVPGAATENARGVVRAVPAAPWTLIAAVRTSLSVENWASTGLLLVKSGSDPYFALSSDGQSQGVFLVDAATPTSSGVVIGTAAYSSRRGWVDWLKVQDDNTNLIFSHSHNGYDWRQIASASRTYNHFSGGAPDRIGVYGNSINSKEIHLELLSWDLSADA
jgi:hypothetical protein